MNEISRSIGEIEAKIRLLEQKVDSLSTASEEKIENDYDDEEPEDTIVIYVNSKLFCEINGKMAIYDEVDDA